MILSKETMLFVSNLLGLDVKGDEQDWEFEFADKNRISEFIDVFVTTDLGPSEKKAVISLILSSYDDYTFSGEDKDEKIWKKIVQVLNMDKGKYEDILNYWAVWKEHREENYFSITPLIRKYLKNFREK